MRRSVSGSKQPRFKRTTFRCAAEAEARRQAATAPGRQHPRSRARQARGGFPAWRGRPLPHQLEGRRLRPQPHGGRLRADRRPLVKPGRRRPGHRPYPPHRAVAAGDGVSPGHGGLDRPDGVDRSLGAIKVFGCVGLVEQEVKEASQVNFGRRRQLNDKAHRPSFLRLASSLDWSFFRTVSTGTETPVRWYSSDAACARAWNAVWTRRKAMAFRTVASTKSVRVSPCLSTDSSSLYSQELMGRRVGLRRCCRWRHRG